MEAKGDKGKWKERSKVEEREEIKRTHTGNASSDTNKQRIPSYILTKNILNELHLSLFRFLSNRKTKRRYK